MTQKIYFHIPRTGGNSIVRALGDNAELKGPELRKLISKNKGIRVLSHDIRNPKYKWLKDFVADNPDCYVFTFVRNPWDRVVSAFFYLNQGGSTKADQKDYLKYLDRYKGDFGKFVKSAFSNKDIFEQMHFKPQYEWIIDDKGNLLSNFIGKYENYARDLQKLSEIIDCELTSSVRHLNKSNHKNYREYYDKQTREIIRNAYERDIELFEYEF